MNNENRHNLHLDPAPDGVGGGAAPASAPAGGDAAPATPAFDESRFVPVEKYQELERTFGETRQQYESRFRDFESRLPKAPEPQADKKPTMSDFMKNGAMTDESFEAYQEAVIAYNLKQHRATWEKEAQESSQREASEARIESTLSAHAERANKYKAENPDYNPRGSLSFRNEAITLAIADSDFSAHIHHFLQKNPDTLAEIRNIEQTKGALPALRYIGRLEAKFENQAAALETRVTTAQTKPTTGAFGTGKGANKNDLTPEKSREIYG